MKTLSQLIDSLTLEQSHQYQAQTDQLMWIETDLLDPHGLSRRHAEKVEEKLIDLLQGEISQVKPANQYDAYLADARQEMNS